MGTINSIWANPKESNVCKHVAHGPIRKAFGSVCCRERQANEDIASATNDKMFEYDPRAQFPALEITALFCNVARIFFAVFATRQ